MFKSCKLNSILYLLFIILAEVHSSQLDNDFAEFEDDEVTISTSEQEVPPIYVQETPKVAEASEEQEVIFEDQDSFDFFHDPEEFEGFPEEEKPEELKFLTGSFPNAHTVSWDGYWLEILMVAGLVVYFINFATGKSKNTKLANTWFLTHKSLLEDNFSLVGDDTTVENKESGALVKESENVFTLWCSGRVCCEGMLVELKLIKRQDLVAILAGMMRPALDQMHVKVLMNKEDMDSFVFCVASKKTAIHLSKEMADISMYCPERRPGEKHNIPSNFNVMSEISEATPAILDSKIVAVLNKFKDFVDYIHFSDQYTGVKQPEDNGQLKLPEAQKVLLFGFNIPVTGLTTDEAMEQVKPLMNMVLYCMDKVRRYRLSKEGKFKADKNRQRVEEAFLKSTHVARAEAAAARREERKRVEKEKVMADADPEKQRRWEEKEQKRQAKKRAPKMKQLKVKAL